MESEVNVITLSSSSDDELVSQPLGKRLATITKNITPVKTKIPKPKFLRNTSVHTFSDSEGSSDNDFPPLVVESSVPSTKTLLPNECQASTSSVTNANKGFIFSLVHSSSDSEPDNLISVNDKVKNPMTRLKKPLSKAKTELKELERQKKQQEKTLAKALKDVDRELARSAKPVECIKSMQLVFDNKFTETSDDISEVFNYLLDVEIPYTIEKNAIPHSVMLYRRVADITVEDNQVLRQERDQVEDLLLLYMPCEEFCEVVSAQSLKQKGETCDRKTLEDHLRNIQLIFPKTKLTCITVGLSPYLKSGQRSVKPGDKSNKSHKKVTKKDVEEAIVDLHVQCLGNYYELSTMKDFGSFLQRFTKAVAEAPFKLEKQSQQKAFSWYAQADSSKPIKVDKDGKGFINLWQQQICQFTTIGKEVAQAIAAKYPSPLLLIKDFRKCATEKEALKLLQDIVVRRDYGPLGTTRRVGPELAYKLYRLFTSTNPSEILQR